MNNKRLLIPLILLLLCVSAFGACLNTKWITIEIDSTVTNIEYQDKADWAEVTWADGHVLRTDQWDAESLLEGQSYHLILRRVERFPIWHIKERPEGEK